ncbi:MAG: DUF302 domain-containing protein [Spirochaetales bacterium]|nr:DUF302 domain-containing protein [Spirochaetales bacterium]
MWKFLKVFFGLGTMTDAILLKNETSRGIEEVASRVSDLCAKFGFSLMTSYSYHEIVASKGFPIERQVFVYKICQAKVASQMLVAHPDFSVFMPCSLSVYEESGKTVVATMDMGLLLSAIRKDPDLYSSASNLFESLKKLMAELAQ